MLPPKGIYLPISKLHSKLHSILAVANLFARNYLYGFVIMGKWIRYG